MNTHDESMYINVIYVTNAHDESMYINVVYVTNAHDDLMHKSRTAKTTLINTIQDAQRVIAMVSNKHLHFSFALLLLLCE